MDIIRREIKRALERRACEATGGHYWGAWHEEPPSYIGLPDSVGVVQVRECRKCTANQAVPNDPRQRSASGQLLAEEAGL